MCPTARMARQSRASGPPTPTATTRAASPTASARCRRVRRVFRQRPKSLAGRAPLLLLIGLTGVCAASLVHAEDREITKRRAAERKTFTDVEIFDGFFKTAFGAELKFAGRADRVRKYDVPVRIYVDNRANPDRSAQVAAVVADIKARVANLDLAMTQDRKAATTIVQLLRERDFYPTLRKAY